MSGIIILNKPRHISSFSAVNIVKRCAGAKKAGHLGTLDVEAEGLLVITLDSATKLFDLYLEKDKEYLSTFFFGEERDTFDLEGKVTRTDNKTITLDMINQALPSFIGKINQLPPSFSAKKIGGKKAYELAREGKEVTLQPKEVEIYDFKVAKELSHNLFTFQISCSSGTYIRSLCRDLARELSTCAECYDIIRTRCGVFNLKDAYTLEQVKAGEFKIIPCDTLFDYDKITLSSDEEKAILNGQFLTSNRQNALYRVYGQGFLGVGEVKDGVLRLKLRLN